MSAEPERPWAGDAGAPPLHRPDLPCPPYRFVPGAAPHPYAHPEGYAHQQRPPDPPFLASAGWRENEAFLRGVDLFNRGWWWEAHEAWEGVWRAAAGHDPAQRRLMGGLIQLAAAALQRERGSDRAAENLLGTAQEQLLEAGQDGPLCGLDPAALTALARRCLGAPTRRVVGLYLLLEG